MVCAVAITLTLNAAWPEFVLRQMDRVFALMSGRSNATKGVVREQKAPEPKFVGFLLNLW